MKARADITVSITGYVTLPIPESVDRDDDDAVWEIVEEYILDNMNGDDMLEMCIQELHVEEVGDYTLIE